MGADGEDGASIDPDAELLRFTLLSAGSDPFVAWPAYVTLPVSRKLESSCCRYVS